MNQLKNDNPDYSSQLHRHIEFLYRELLVTKILLALVALVSLISDGYLLFKLENTTTKDVICPTESESPLERESQKSYNISHFECLNFSIV